MEYKRARLSEYEPLKPGYYEAEVWFTYSPKKIINLEAVEGEILKKFYDSLKKNHPESAPYLEVEEISGLSLLDWNAVPPEVQEHLDPDGFLSEYVLSVAQIRFRFSGSSPLVGRILILLATAILATLATVSIIYTTMYVLIPVLKATGTSLAHIARYGIYVGTGLILVIAIVNYVRTGKLTVQFR